MLWWAASFGKQLISIAFPTVHCKPFCVGSLGLAACDSWCEIPNLRQSMGRGRIWQSQVTEHQALCSLSPGSAT